MRKLFSLLNDESGATAIEYALVASLISISIVAGVSNLTSWLNTDFSKISSSVGNSR